MTRYGGRGVEGVDRLFGCARVGSIQTSVAKLGMMENAILHTQHNIHEQLMSESGYYTSLEPHSMQKGYMFVGHPEWMNVARSIYHPVHAIFDHPAVAGKPLKHLPNGSNLLSHSRIRSRTITTPIPCSLSKDPLSSPPTLYPPNAESS